MEAKELRIGNWIKVDDLPAEQVTFETFATLLKFPATIGAFKGIIITEDRLLNLGFAESGRHKTLWQKDGLSIWFYPERPSVMLHKCEPNLFNYRYVHQLQNLFFALTGKELTIK